MSMRLGCPCLLVDVENELDDVRGESLVFAWDLTRSLPGGFEDFNIYVSHDSIHSRNDRCLPYLSSH